MGGNMAQPTAFNYRVKSIVKIIDGDTFDCVLDLGFDVLLEARVRMMGIDTPESRTRDKEEKVYGLLAKNWLKKHIDKDIIITTHVNNEKGKFGRILGTVWKDGVNINEQMIAEGHAVSYHGQNKDDVQAAHMSNRQLLQERGLV